MLDQLEESKLLPEEMLADTLYCGDENVQAAEDRGVELVGPIPGREPASDPAALTLDDFAVDERTGRVEACPQGHMPLVVERDEEAGTTRIEMAPEACEDARSATPARSTRRGTAATRWISVTRIIAWLGGGGNKRPRCSRSGTRDALGHRVDQQRLEESAGFEAAEGARARERVPCDPAQSGRLERAAGGGVEEAARLGERPSGPDAERRRIWAKWAALRPRFAAVGRFSDGFPRLSRLSA